MINKEQFVSDVAHVMQSRGGRRFVHTLIYDVCDIEGGTFFEKVHDGVCQTQHQNVREGQRDVAIELMQTFKTDVDLTALWVVAKEEALAQVSDELKALSTKTRKRRK